MAKCVCKAAPIIGAVFAGLALALAGAAQADETRASLVVPASGTSAPITIPGVGTATAVTCARTETLDQGMGQATLVRFFPTTQVLWFGTGLVNGVPQAVSGKSSTLGTAIVSCSFTGSVIMEVFSGSQIQIHNTDPTQSAHIFVHFNY